MIYNQHDSTSSSYNLSN